MIPLRYLLSVPRKIEAEKSYYSRFSTYFAELIRDYDIVSVVIIVVLDLKKLVFEEKVSDLLIDHTENLILKFRVFRGFSRIPRN